VNASCGECELPLPSGPAVRDPYRQLPEPLHPALSSQTKSGGFSQRSLRAGCVTTEIVVSSGGLLGDPWLSFRLCTTAWLHKEVQPADYCSDIDHDNCCACRTAAQAKHSLLLLPDRTSNQTAPPNCCHA